MKNPGGGLVQGWKSVCGWVEGLIENKNANHKVSITLFENKNKTTCSNPNEWKYEMSIPYPLIDIVSNNQDCLH